MIAEFKDSTKIQYDKILMQHLFTGKCILTQAHLLKSKYQKIINQGYKPICFIQGFNRLRNIKPEEWLKINQIKPI